MKLTKNTTINPNTVLQVAKYLQSVESSVTCKGAKVKRKPGVDFY